MGGSTQSGQPLARLRSTQEITLLTAVRAATVTQQEEAEQAYQALLKTKAVVAIRRDYYQTSRP